MDPRLAKEEATEILHGNGMEYLFLWGFKTKIDEMKKDLLTNVSLEEGTRKAYIITIQTIQEGFKELYRKAKVRVPEWLEKEFPE